MSKIDILMWDWRDNVDLDELAEVLRKYGIKIIEIDTQIDCFAIAIGQSSMSKREADAAYNQELEC